MRRFKSLRDIFLPQLPPGPDPNGTDHEVGVDPEWMGEAPAPTVVVENHPFAPDQEVGFYPAHAVGVERSLGREPMPDPTQIALVSEEGTLEVSDLEAGEWYAVAQVGDRFRYVKFPVA